MSSFLFALGFSPPLGRSTKHGVGEEHNCTKKAKCNVLRLGARFFSPFCRRRLSFGCLNDNDGNVLCRRVVIWLGGLEGIGTWWVIAFSGAFLVRPLESALEKCFVRCPQVAEYKRTEKRRPMWGLMVAIIIYEEDVTVHTHWGFSTEENSGLCLIFSYLCAAINTVGFFK